MVDGNLPDTKHEGHSVYSPSLSEWYRVLEQSVAHVSQLNDWDLFGVSALEATTLIASADETGLDERDVEW